MSVDLSCLHAKRLTNVTTDGFNWFFTFSDGAALRVEALWRFIENGRLARGSVDHLQKFGLPEPVDAAQTLLASLANHEIREARIVPDSGDLILLFSESRLEILNTSAGYEAWALALPDGRAYIAQGGGRIVGG